MKKKFIVYKEIMKLGSISVNLFYSIFFLLLSMISLLITCTSAPTKSEITRMKEMQNSPQWRDGKFHNSLAPEPWSTWETTKTWLLEKSSHTQPKKPYPYFTRKKDDFATSPQSGLRVTWLGHSTVLIEIDGFRILTDPVWSDRPSPVSFIGPKRFFPPPLTMEDVPPLDAIVISHNHYDHLDEASIRGLKDTVPVFIVPLGVGKLLEEWDIEKGKIIELDWWAKTTIQKLTITATPARHFSGRSVFSMLANDTLWCGWSIAGPKHRVYYSGDTAMFPGLVEIGQKLGPFDLTLIESGAYNGMWADFHLGPEQAVQAHKMVNGKVMIPVHWGTFDLALHGWTEPAERAMVAAHNQNARLAIPRPGQSIEPSSLPPLVRWWPELPWQSAEKAPVVSSGMNRSFYDE